MELTREQISHYLECENFEYFIKEHNPKLLSNYCELLNSTQNIILDNQTNNHSELIEWYLTWFLVFHKCKTIVVLDRRQRTAIEILDRCKDIFNHFPSWMKPSVTYWSKKHFELENCSRIIVSACTPSTIKGISVNLLYLANFSDVSDSFAIEFVKCYLPVISSSKQSHMIVTGNDNGNDTYKKLVTSAKEGNCDCLFSL